MILGRKLPEPIQLSNRNQKDSIKLFLTTTTALFCKILGVGLPPEEKLLAGVEIRLAKEKPLQQPNNRVQQQKHWVMVMAQTTNRFMKSKEQMKQLLVTGPYDPNSNIQFPRMVSEIRFSSRAKDNRQELFNFVWASVTLRCASFHLPPIPKLKLERMIFEPKLKMNCVGSVAAGLTMIELIKHFVVSSHSHVGKSEVHNQFRVLQTA